MKHRVKENIVLYRFLAMIVTVTSLGLSGCAFNIGTSERYFDCGDYSEGYAWVEYRKESMGETQWYYAVIDKNGSMLFQYEFDYASAQFPSPFQNGYAYLINKQWLHVINTAGEITAEYKLDDEHKATGCGDGYVVEAVHLQGFSGNSWKYTIYTPKGTEVINLDRENDDLRIHYCGNDVFQLRLSEHANDTILHSDGYTDFYFANSNRMIQYNTDTNVYFYDDMAIISVGHAPVLEDYIGEKQDDSVIFMDSNGQITSDAIEDVGWLWVDDAFRNGDGLCVLTSFEDSLIIYNSYDDTYRRLENEYAERIRWDYVANPLLINNGRIALPMKGDDGNNYTVTFDTEWNLIGEPVQCDVKAHANYSCGRLVVGLNAFHGNVSSEEDRVTMVYDENMQVVFTLSDIGEYYRLAPYSDNVARVSGYIRSDAEETSKIYNGIKNPVYLDTEGNILFDKVDTSRVITVTLNSK